VPTPSAYPEVVLPASSVFPPVPRSTLQRRYLSATKSSVAVAAQQPVKRKSKPVASVLHEVPAETGAERTSPDAMLCGMYTVWPSGDKQKSLE
jgi:hypothetical protein